MGEVVNLRRARKNKQRQEKARHAEANRLKFGRSKEEIQSAEAIKQQLAAQLDGHLREKIPKKETSAKTYGEIDTVDDNS